MTKRLTKDIVVGQPDNLNTKEGPIFQTYYNRSYRDKPLVSDLSNSLTDQDYKMMTDIDYLLSHMAGQSRTPLYGVQDNMTFEDWSNEMAHVKRRYNDLSPEVRKQFANAQEYLAWASNPNNYVEQLPLVKQKKMEKFQEEQLTEKANQKYKQQAILIAEAMKGNQTKSE